tara:strand:- start:71 stop:274 length:204 start_codon:yes stop_codon:yes gene_type:complete
MLMGYSMHSISALRQRLEKKSMKMAVLHPKETQMEMECLMIPTNAPGQIPMSRRTKMAAAPVSAILI